MGILPSLKAKDIIRALKKIGFIEDRQKGSHLTLIHPETKTRAVVPMHSGRDIKKPLVRAIINDARLTVEDFIKLL